MVFQVELQNDVRSCQFTRTTTRTKTHAIVQDGLLIRLQQYLLEITLGAREGDASDYLMGLRPTKTERQLI